MQKDQLVQSSALWKCTEIIPSDDEVPLLCCLFQQLITPRLKFYLIYLFYLYIFALH